MAKVLKFFFFLVAQTIGVLRQVLFFPLTRPEYKLFTHAKNILLAQEFLLSCATRVLLVQACLTKE